MEKGLKTWTGKKALLKRKAKSLTAKFVAAAVIASGLVPAGFTGLTAEAAETNPKATLTVNMDPSVPEDERATINVNASRSERLIETRGEFDVPRRLLLPLLQAELDANPKLKQNPGY